MGDNMHANENKRNRGENIDHTRTLRDLFAPVATNSPSCIVLPPTNVTHFDLKPHVIQLLPAFHGLDLENPYSHVKKFKDICATFKFQNFSEESVHHRAQMHKDIMLPTVISPCLRALQLHVYST
jgi:hypothetical protein